MKLTPTQKEEYAFGEQIVRRLLQHFVKEAPERDYQIGRVFITEMFYGDVIGINPAIVQLVLKPVWLWTRTVKQPLCYVEISQRHRTVSLGIQGALAQQLITEEIVLKALESIGESGWEIKITEESFL